MKRINLNDIRFKILFTAKKYIVSNGWNENIISLVASKGKYREEEVISLFPEGYKSILKYYLSSIDQEMINNSKKMNLIRMKTHEKIRKIILLRFKINEKEKKIIQRTFFTLMLPQHTKKAVSSIYTTVDQIWHIAGDNSTDFNYYTKRAILFSIYFSTLFYWLNNKNITSQQLGIYLDSKLSKVNKIPKLKKRVKSITNLLSGISLFEKFFSTSRQ